MDRYELPKGKVKSVVVDGGVGGAVQIQVSAEKSSGPDMLLAVHGSRDPEVIARALTASQNLEYGAGAASLVSIHAAYGILTMLEAAVSGCAPKHVTEAVAEATATAQRGFGAVIQWLSESPETFGAAVCANHNANNAMVGAMLGVHDREKSEQVIRDAMTGISAALSRNFDRSVGADAVPKCQCN